ncbi:MAG: hypothetical protein IJ094_08355 [Bacilli bacterium]|nr:hypothetical protein [Bacilli bacterium]
MENKVLIILSIPELDQDYDLMIPVSRKVGNIIELIAKFLKDETEEQYEVVKNKNLYNRDTSQRYNNNVLVIDTDIRNGTKLILI